MLLARMVRREFEPVVTEAQQTMEAARLAMAAVVVFTAIAAIAALLTLAVVTGRDD